LPASIRVTPISSPSSRGGHKLGFVRPLLTVVVPVYNGGDEIVANVDVIRESVAGGLPDDAVELIVVSDGSIDGTAERLLESRGERGIRVLHYDRNLGKGYAVKAGARAARGDWIALVDADLDLDPASIPDYLEAARRDDLDLAVGSKRHPDSVVHYPRSRRIASWCYQQLNRLLFRLDVRDTQVGLKVFSRRVADDVLPLLLVKRFAFDLELLAVASSLGYTRIRELPVRLDYRFSGSGVGSLAVLGALWDTAAIFYRLRILRTYERKRRLFHGAAATTPEQLPVVTVIGDPSAAALLDYPRLARDGELVAVLGPGARPAGNWVSAAVPFFAESDVAAVVVPTVSPLRGPLGRRVAAAVLESRLGAGSRRSSYLPGNVREVSDHAAESIVLRRDDHDAVSAAGVEPDRVVAWLAEHGRRTIYSPDTSVSAPPAPLLRPHLAATFRHARARGAAARRSRGTSLSAATALSLTPAAAAVVGVVFVLVGGAVRTAGYMLLLAYAAALAVSGIHGALRFRSPAVGLLQPLAVVASQATYLGGFVRGLMERPKHARREARALAS
jgi:glycosyltransferase involved in cell wall biosynthesis